MTGDAGEREVCGPWGAAPVDPDFDREAWLRSVNQPRSAEYWDAAVAALREFDTNQRTP